MKLRIKGNSIRLRLLRSEVERFSAEGTIADEVRFGKTGLKYSLLMSDGTDSISAGFAGEEISVVIPKAVASHWATTETVGLETEQPIGDGQTLAILIEKDFECIDRPDDPDRADAYANPNATC
jgi:hypothetical protein